MYSPAEVVVKSENSKGRLVCGMWGKAREHGICMETMRGSSWPHAAHSSCGNISLRVLEMSGKPAGVSLLSCWTPAVIPLRTHLGNPKNDHKWKGEEMQFSLPKCYVPIFLIYVNQTSKDAWWGSDEMLRTHCKPNASQTAGLFFFFFLIRHDR